MTREDAERIYGAPSVAAQHGSQVVTITMYGPVDEDRFQRTLAEAKHRAEQLSYVAPTSRERRSPARVEEF